MSSIGKDLAKIRSSLGLTLQDIQSTIKIPIATLEKIENDTIHEDSEHGETYVRSFIRSYGRALKIDSEVMINGLNQHETGNYNQLLWNHYEAGQESPSFKNFTFDDEEPATEEPTTKEPKRNEITPPTVEETSKDEILTDQVPQKEESDPKSPKKIQSPTKSPEDVDWADMGLKFTESKKATPVWLFVILILLMITIVIGYFIYSNDLINFTESSPSDAEIAASTVESNRELLDLNDPVDSGITDATVDEGLDEILYITIYAAYERLEPVRVWSDIKPRMDPYWVEQGVAMNFDFRDTVRIRGQYDNMLIFKNGHSIDDVLEANFNQQENYIELTRDYFSSDPKWISSQPFQLPEEVAQPDTVLLRPTF